MAELNVAQEDRHLRRSLGLWQLTAIGFSGVIGSGWLLGAMVGAQIAGPEAIAAWLVGGAALMLIALVMADLGAARPESGGLIRWPYYSSGRLVATIAGWGIWIAYATNPPSESAAMLQYASKYVPDIYNGSSLTRLRILLGIGVMAVFVLINWFGVLLFARINGALTAAKFVVPTLTVIALFISGFHSANFSSYGGFAPYGWTPGLSAIATAGIIYAYTGFQGPIDLSGEARNPRRDVPRAVIMSLAGANWIPAPGDSVLVAVIGLIGYEWGVRDAVRHLTVHPARSPRAPTRTPTTPWTISARRRPAETQAAAGPSRPRRR
jgi:amino acid transporter